LVAIHANQLNEKDEDKIAAINDLISDHAQEIADKDTIISKAADDLINKCHVFDKKFSLKSKTSSGATFSAEAKVIGDKGIPASKVGLKFSPLSGFNVSKLEYNNSGRIDLEADTTVEGFKFIFKNQCGASGDDPAKGKPFSDSASLSLEYGTSYEGLAFTANAGLDALKYVPSVGLLASYEGILLGGNAEFKQNFGGLSKYEVALGYAGADNKAVLKSSKFERLDFSYHHRVNSDFTFAALASHTLSKKKDEKVDAPKVSIGGIWSLDSDAKIQSNINEKAEISVSYIQNLKKGVELTLSTGFDGKSADFTRAGAGLAFSF